MKLNNVIKEYAIFLITCMLVVLGFRIAEYGLLILKYNDIHELLVWELFGLCYDYALLSVVLIGLFPIYFLLNKISPIVAKSIVITGLALYAISTLLILRYFIYQLIPLDTFFLKYSFHDIILTIESAGVNVFLLILSLFTMAVVVVLLYFFLHKINISKKAVIILYTLLILCVPTSIILHHIKLFDNVFCKNKPLYFYKNAIKTVLHKEIAYNEGYALEYQRIFSNKSYLNTEYPLLHKENTFDSLGQYFNVFQTAPNIVIIIVEGLNDDYVHTYHQAVLMPFLHALQDKSLYWSRCLTLGERSFAALPCITGSLPYGKEGFTLIDTLPLHQSLFSILKKNNYFTSYYYTQGSWFDNKDKYLNYNHVDLICDKDKFNPKYHKIIVGSDCFFWGYNDKDLFNQSFEVMDTLKEKKRFDVYYTGTMHSPFVIADSLYYEQKFKLLIQSLKNDTDKLYFERNKQFILSILFTDDALAQFFERYKQRPEFKNTMFIITGDHPMSEMPVVNCFKRYHVPLYIYAENLKVSKKMTNIVSHLDIYPTVLACLKKYGIKIPEYSTALGDNLFTNKQRKIVFMRGNRSMELYSEGYFLSENQLYEVDNDFLVKKIINNQLFSEMNYQLSIFEQINTHVCYRNKLLPQ